MESKQGYIEIEVEFRNLQPASKFGAEYLTYVLWAVTPEGRTANLGEVLLNGTSSKLDVTTELQVFGLVVTAEPYFAVTQPSDLIVMENAVRADTKGKVEEIDARYELLQRGQYEHLANPLALKLDRAERAAGTISQRQSRERAGKPLKNRLEEISAAATLPACLSCSPVRPAGGRECNLGRRRLFNTHSHRLCTSRVGPAGIDSSLEEVVGTIGQVGDQYHKKRSEAVCAPGEP